EEVDAIAQPAGPGEVAVQLHERAEGARTVRGLGVDPHRARRAAAVALPPGRLAAGMAAEHDAGGGTEGDAGGGAKRELAREAAVERHGVEPLLAGEGAAGVGGVENGPAVGRPAGDAALRALVGEAARRAAG